MNVLILDHPGNVDALQYAMLPVPAPAANEVLVELKAISINPIDVKTRKGAGLYGKLSDNKPIVLGWDISGIIVECGSGATNFQVGDEVFGMINFPGHGRAYAQFVRAPESHLALKPSNVSHEAAAAATLAALTAWQGLAEHAQLKQGQKVLIHAAAGGVGHFAVQIAKYLGAYVIGTGSSGNRDFILGLGADEFFDYQERKFETQYKELDLVFDGVGGETMTRSFEVLRAGGTIVSLPSASNANLAELAAARGFKGKPMLVYSSAEGMRQIATLLAQGVIKPHISQTFAWDQMRHAHQAIEQGHTRGKVVVRL